jgi:hypothetical protein
MVHMARTLSPTLAAVVEELELDQPSVVTMDVLSEIAARRELATLPKIIAARLRQHGWLLPTGVRGVWEFAPGSHAGPYGHADPGTPLHAALAANPDLNGAVSLGTAAWAQGFADRVPAPIDVSVPKGTHVPAGLSRSASVTIFTTAVGYVTVKGVPCHRPETVLVHLATDPSAPRSWQAVTEWLPEIAAEADSRTFADELAPRSRAAKVRAGYLLSGLRPDLVAPLTDLVGPPVRFGRRTQQLRRYANSWRVLDFALPADPASWEPSR